MALFIELPVFTRLKDGLLDEESYRELQNAILNKTTRIDHIPRVKGLFKARWEMPNRGKKSGVRVVFAPLPGNDVYLLLVVYDKTQKDDLSHKEAEKLADLVQAQILKMTAGQPKGGRKT